MRSQAVTMGYGSVVYVTYPPSQTPCQEPQPVDTPQLSATSRSLRVLRSFAFLDLCGFTDFSDEHGDETAVSELQQLRSAVREVTPLFGVRIEKWLGDGAMLVATENEPIVAAVVAIEQRYRRHARLEMRAGIATGEVLLLEGDDYVGRCVNLASRLCETAGAGEILAAVDGLHLPTWVEVAEQTTVNAKGMSAPVDVVRLVPSASALETTRPHGVILSLAGGLARRAGVSRSAWRRG